MSWSPTQLTVVIITSVSALYALYVAQQAILVVLFAVLLAIGYTGLLKYVSDKIGASFGITLAGTLLLTALLIGGLGWYAAPQLQEQVDIFMSTAQSVETGELLPSYISDSNTSVTSIIQDNSSRLLAELGSVFSTSFSVASFLVVIVFIALYGAWNNQTYYKATQRLQSIFGTGFVESIDTITSVTRKWLLGRILSMVIVGILTYVGLLALGVSVPLLLAILAGLFSFIPNIGPILSVVPAILVVSGAGLLQIGLVITLYVVIQFIESYVLTPRIQQNLIAVPPALLLAAQLVLGTIFGIMGLLLAAPVTAIIVALVRDHLPDTSD